MPALSAVDRRLLESDLPPLRHALLSSGSTLEYRDTGHGADAVLLLHGIGSSSAGYRAQLAGLSAQWRLLAWNAPGFGASTPLASPAPDVHAYAAALAELLDALSLDRVHLVASSWGTLIAQAFAGRYPERTRAIVLSVPTRGYAHLPADERARRMAERLSPGARTQTPEERAPASWAPLRTRWWSGASASCRRRCIRRDWHGPRTCCSTATRLPWRAPSMSPR